MHRGSFRIAGRIGELRALSETAIGLHRLPDRSRFQFHAAHLKSAGLNVGDCGSNRILQQRALSMKEDTCVAARADDRAVIDDRIESIRTAIVWRVR